MTKAKKAIGVILAVVMLATMFAFGSLAATPGNATFTVTPSATQVEVGDTITVTVKVTTDYYAGPVSVPVHYDAALFDYVENSCVPNADIYGKGAAEAKAFNNNGCLTVGFSPLSEVAGAKAQVLTDVTLFTFQLTAKANGVSPVELKAEDQKAVGNMTGKLYCGQKANADLASEDTMIGQTFTLNNSSVTIGSTAADPELQLSDYGAEMGAVIDRTRCIDSGDFAGCVYGVDTINGEDLATYLTTPAGSINVLENASGVISTGATVELLDASGNVVETYVFVYFGDVNMDGSVDTLDASLIEEYSAYVSDIPDEHALLAADANGDMSPDTLDSSLIEEYSGYISDLPTQAEVAAVYAG